MAGLNDEWGVLACSESPKRSYVGVRDAPGLRDPRAEPEIPCRGLIRPSGWQVINLLN